jgi:hypothetical protein
MLGPLLAELPLQMEATEPGKWGASKYMVNKFLTTTAAQ